MPQHLDNKMISIQMEKTRNNLIIPIPERALKYVPEKIEYEKPVFPQMARPYLNRELKAMVRDIGINKPITTKRARHSFAVLFLPRGGNIFSLKNILGHRKIESTMVYSRIVPTDLTKQMMIID
jgi:integrase